MTLGCSDDDDDDDCDEVKNKVNSRLAKIIKKLVKPKNNVTNKEQKQR